MMPRILWEQADSVVGSVPILWREEVLVQLRQVVAEEVTRYDPSFQLDWEKHTVVDIAMRHKDAKGDNPIIITIRGMNKPPRVDNSKKIGDAIHARMDPLFLRGGFKWTLSLCWDEHYYNNGEG